MHGRLIFVRAIIREGSFVRPTDKRPFGPEGSRPDLTALRLCAVMGVVEGLE